MMRCDFMVFTPLNKADPITQKRDQWQGPSCRAAQWRRRRMVQKSARSSQPHAMALESSTPMADPLVSFLASADEIGAGVSSRPRPTVQLLHTLPDGSAHMDWMIGSVDDPEQRLVTFRLRERLENLTINIPLAIKRIADHRPSYLEYEGSIGGDRGHVRRLSRGFVESVSMGISEREWLLEIAWQESDRHQSRQLVRLRCGADEAWTVEILPVGESNGVESSAAAIRAHPRLIGAKEQ